MAPHAIISYDDTPSDHDALALGRVLAGAGTRLTLAYVRHTTQRESSREEFEDHEARALLERGARQLAELEVAVAHRIVISASTGEGLRQLAREEDADIVVFGSDYRTAAGHLAPQHSARILLEGGSTAVALAPADYRSLTGPQITSIGVLDDPGDDAALGTARELSRSFDADIGTDPRSADLLVVASRAEASRGQVMLAASAQNEIENATCPVLVVPRGAPIKFPSAVLAGT